MKSFYLLLLITLSPLSFANEVSLHAIFETIKNNGFDQAKNLSELHSELLAEKNVIHMSDKLGAIGSDSLVNPTWFYQLLSNNAFQISIPLGQHYIRPDETFGNFIFLECLGSGASSGVKYITFENGTTVFYNYSTGSRGSRGSTFQFIFENNDFEKYKESTNQKCKTHW